MYKKILVPLDGSALGECVLEHVKAIANGCQVSEVVLLRVVEPLPAEAVAALAEAGGNSLTIAEAEHREGVNDYLIGVTERLKKDGIKAAPVMADGSAAEEILSYAEGNGADLIIMSTHGRSGVSRWFFGSVADRVVRYSRVPVLTVSPPGCRLVRAGE